MECLVCGFAVESDNDVCESCRKHPTVFEWIPIKPKREDD